MRAFPHRLYAMLTGAAILGASALIASDAGRAEPGTPMQAAPALMLSSMTDSGTTLAALLNDDSVTYSAKSDKRAAPAAGRILDAELECVAKVIHHEASNQSRRGQLAVAQVMVNRTRSGRFPTSLCDVANQPGQFFNLARYNPSHATERWENAVEVAREAMAGQADDVTNGAYYYHAAYAAPNSFFRSRERVLKLEDHIFYR